MCTKRVKSVEYEGETKIIGYDPEDPEALEEIEDKLDGFMELEEGQQLYTKVKHGHIEVRKLTKKINTE